MFELLLVKVAGLSALFPFHGAPFFFSARAWQCGNTSEFRLVLSSPAWQYPGNILAISGPHTTAWGKPRREYGKMYRDTQIYKHICFATCVRCVCFCSLRPAVGGYRLPGAQDIHHAPGRAGSRRVSLVSVTVRRGWLLSGRSSGLAPCLTGSRRALPPRPDLKARYLTKSNAIKKGYSYK